MSKSQEKLNRAIEAIDDRFIIAASTPPKRRPAGFVRTGYLAASLAALVAVTVALTILLISYPSSPQLQLQPGGTVTPPDDIISDTSIANPISLSQKDGVYYAKVIPWGETISIPDRIDHPRQTVFEVLGHSAWIADVSDDGSFMYVHILTKGEDSAETHYFELHPTGASLTRIEVSLNFRNHLCGTIFIREIDKASGLASMDSFLSTKDGGKTWERVYFDGGFDSVANVSNGSCYMNEAKLITENVGIIYYRIAPEAFSAFLTEDGGVTWFALTDLPFPRLGNNSFDSLRSLIDFSYSSGAYHLRTGGTYNSIDYSIEFYSEDLRNWRIYDPMSTYNTFADYESLLDCYVRMSSYLRDNSGVGDTMDQLYVKAGIPMGSFYENLFSSVYGMAVNSHVRLAAMSYAYKDLNSDGIDELIILDSAYCIYGIYTKVNGKIKEVGTFAEHNPIASIDAEGNIYVDQYSKVSAVMYVGRLDSSGEIVPFFKSTEVYDENGDCVYSIMKNGILEKVYAHEAAAYNVTYQKQFESPAKNTQGAGLEAYPLIEDGGEAKG